MYIKRITFFFIFITHQVFSINQNDLQLIDTLKEFNLLSKKTQIIGSKKPKHSEYVKKIIFTKDDISLKIIKIEKESDNFKKNKKKLKEDMYLIEHINQLALDDFIKIPKIIVNQYFFYLKNYFGFIQDAANGKTLGEYDLAHMEDADIYIMFNSIGTQFGNLDHLLHKYNEVLIHPDGHPFNFIYDNMEKRLYWIDTAGIKEKMDKHKNYLNASRTTNTSLLGTIYFNQFLMLAVDASENVTDYPYEFRNHKSIFYISEPDQIDKIKLKIKEDDTLFASNHRRLKETLREEIRIRLLVNNKFALAIQSLGQAYVNAYPEIKSIYNDIISSSSIYHQIRNSNLLRKAIDEPSESIIDLLIP